VWNIKQNNVSRDWSSHVDIWGKNIPRRKNYSHQDCPVGVCLRIQKGASEGGFCGEFNVRCSQIGPEG
jgi:hypothetical protein